MKTIRFGLTAFLAVGVAGYGFVAYLSQPLGSLVHPEMMANFRNHQLGIYSHIFASALALLIGPLQFSTRFRSGYPTFHRWLGRLYLGVGVLVGGLAGLYMAGYAFGGWWAKLGFGGLAASWLYTGWRGYAAIRRGDIDEHNRWLIRNFALTFAAVTLRIYLPLSLAGGIPFEIAYRFIAWLAWLPNLLIAQLIIAHTFRHEFFKR